MVLKSEKERLRLLVRETLTLLCKNGLPYKSQFNLEALVGITLDKKEVLLVSINEKVVGSNDVQPFPVMLTKSQTARRGSGRKLGLLRGGKSRSHGRGIKRPRPPELDGEIRDGAGMTDNNTTQGDETKPEVVGMSGEGSHGNHTYIDDTIKTETDMNMMNEKTEIGENNGNETTSSDDSDAGSLPDDSSSDSMDDDEDDHATFVLQQMRSDITTQGLPAMDERSLQLRAAQTGLLAEFQTLHQSSTHSKSKGEKGKQNEPKLTPMGPEETARIWAKALENMKDQKDQAPAPSSSTSKKKSPKKRRSGGDTDTESQDKSKDDKSDAPPMCHICGKSMSTEKNLTKHVRRHLGMFSVYCDDCGKGFFDRTDLDAHAAKHDNRKLYQCHICGRSYSHNRGLLKHIRKDHVGALTGQQAALMEAGQPLEHQQIVSSMSDATNPNHGLPRQDTPLHITPQAPPQTQPQAQVPPPPQPSPHQASHPQPIPTPADSQMSQIHTPSLSLSLGTPLSQALPQIPQQMSHMSAPGILPSPAHLAHFRPDLPFPAGLHPVPDAYYYSASYPSQSVFPGGPGN